jgi:betaine-aldehyde dehydrogenase
MKKFCGVEAMIVMQKLFINGVWTQGKGGSFSPINPVSATVSSVFSIPSDRQISDAVEAAGNAVEARVWSGKKWHERARILEKIASTMDARIDDLARAQSVGNGKTLTECRAQARAAADVFRYYASVAETYESEITTQRTESVTFSIQEPVGVVLAITPWNSPLTLEAQKIAPILAAGNSVILKPSEVTPHVSCLYAEILQYSGIPSGVFNVLFGEREVGEKLVSHSGISMITFTGGTGAGRAIASEAGKHLRPVILELGGKSPNIILADADLDQAAKGAAAGIFSGGGQSCIAGSRIMVESSVCEEFTKKFLSVANAYRYGLPDDPDAQFGAMATFQHRDKVHQMVLEAEAAGGHILLGGAIPADAPFDVGAFYPATIISGLSPDAELCREEAFGPVCVIQSFNNMDDLNALANGTDYGLAAGIWTKSANKAWSIARSIKAGTVWINTYKELSISTPFGGFKSSGLWREKGLQGMQIYMENKGIYWNFENS